MTNLDLNALKAVTDVGRQSVPAPLLPLTSYTREVERTRAAFFTSMDSFPVRVAESVRGHYLDKLSREKGRPTLGEYTPWMVSDLLGINNEAAVARVAIPWMNLYVYTVIIDNLIDRTGLKDSPALLVASGLLLERGLTGLRSLLPNEHLYSEARTFLTEMAYAAVDEVQNHRHKVVGYTDDDVTRLGQKVAGLKLCGAYLLGLAPRNTTRGNDLRVLDVLGTAMQLLDDLGDWEEDWRSGNYTLPLTVTLAKLSDIGIGVDEQRLLTSQTLLTGLVLSGALEQTLARSMQALATCVSQLGPERDTPTHQMLTNLISAGTALRQKSRHTYDSFWSRHQHGTRVNWLEQAMDDPVTTPEIMEIKQNIRIVAQSS